MTYVTSDLHGYPLDEFKLFLENINFSAEDKLYILGDVIDRGNHGIEILKWILESPNVELLLGNHEDMLLKVKSKIYNRFSEDPIEYEKNNSKENEEVEDSQSKEKDFNIWMRNGGEPTFSSLKKENKETLDSIFNLLENARLYQEIEIDEKKFVLVHGGLDNFHETKKLKEYTREELLWTRPFEDTKYFEDKKTIIGHTPTAYYGIENIGKAYKTKTWIDIDVGAASGRSPMILRLDDMKYFYF